MKLTRRLFILATVALASEQVFANSFTITLFDDYNLTIDSIKNSQGKPMIRYQLDLPKESYLGIGYGTSMKGVDMVAFVSSTSNPHVEDLYSQSESMPPNDMS